MKLISVPNNNGISFHGARLISAQIMLKSDSVLGLATGSSPVGVYQQLAADCKDNLLDFSQVKTVNLDEYWEMDGTHEQSYRYFMNDNLFNHVNIDIENTNVPNGKANHPEEECARYDALIRSLGGIDLLLMGIGSNGHIGFNEPGETFSCGTHLQELKAETREANKRFFEKMEDVPTHALTMGIREIMQSKCIVMLASGLSKAEAIRDCFYGEITPKVPGSILQLHPNFFLIADAQALSMIPNE